MVEDRGARVPGGNRLTEVRVTLVFDSPEEFTAWYDRVREALTEARDEA